MFTSQNTGPPCDEKTEGSRPTFQTPLRMKAASSGFLGKPKAAEVGNRVRDDGPALPSLVLQIIPPSEATSRQEAEQPVTSDGCMSALPIDTRTTGIVIHDENLLRTKEATVTGPDGLVVRFSEPVVDGPVVIASMNCEIANKGENESVTEEGSNSDCTSETEPDLDSWTLDEVARRGKLPKVESVLELIEVSQLSDPSEDSIEGTLKVLPKDSLEDLLEDLLESPRRVLPKVSLECSVKSSSGSKVPIECDQILTNQEGSLHGDCEKTNGDSRKDLGHGDFQTEAGQDSVVLETEGDIDSRSPDPVGLEKKDSVGTRAQDSDTWHDAVVDVWIEEAKIEAKILIASKEESIPCNEESSKVQSEVSKSGNEPNRDGTDLQYEKIDSTEINFNPNSAETEIHSTELSSLEISATETNFADAQSTDWESTGIVPADVHSGEPACDETCFPEVVTATYNFPDTIYGVTQTDACSTCSNSTTVEANNVDVFELTLPGTQTIGTKSDSDDSKYAASHSTETSSLVSSDTDTISDDWCSEDSSNSSEMETAKMELADSICNLDSELEEHNKKSENSLEKAIDKQKTEDEQISSSPDTKPVEMSKKSADPQKTEEELHDTNLENSNFPVTKPMELSDKSADSQKTEEEERSDDKPSGDFNLLRTLLHSTLGAWMHYWGPPSCS